MLAMAGYDKVDLPASTTPCQSPTPPGGELFKSIDGKPGPGWKDRVVRFFARLSLSRVQLVSADVVSSFSECFQQAEKECRFPHSMGSGDLPPTGVQQVIEDLFKLAWTSETVAAPVGTDPAGRKRVGDQGCRSCHGASTVKRGCEPS